MRSLRFVTRDLPDYRDGARCISGESHCEQMPNGMAEQNTFEAKAGINGTDAKGKDAIHEQAQCNDGGALTRKTAGMEENEEECRNQYADPSFPSCHPYNQAHDEEVYDQFQTTRGEENTYDSRPERASEIRQVELPEHCDGCEGKQDTKDA